MTGNSSYYTDFIHVIGLLNKLYTSTMQSSALSQLISQGSTMPQAAALQGRRRLHSPYTQHTAHRDRRMCRLIAHAEHASSSVVATTAELQPAAAPASSTLTVYFRAEDVTVEASPGEDLVEVCRLPCNLLVHRIVCKPVTSCHDNSVNR